MPMPNDTDDTPLVEAHYECPACGNTWIMEWECACDDECSECGAIVEACDSVSIIDGTGDSDQ